MKVLFIDDEIPIPVNTGKRSRTYNLLKRLSNDCEITYVAYINENEKFDEIKILKNHGIQVNPVHERKLRKESKFFYPYLIINCFSRYPYIVSGHYTKRMFKKVKELIKGTKFDIIHVEISTYGNYVKEVSKIPKCIVAHNVESDIWRRYLENESNLFKKLFIRFQLSKLIKYEAQIFKKFQGVITVSKNDAKRILNYQTSGQTMVIDNGVDIEYFKGNNRKVSSYNIVFSGSMDWRPNQDAVQYFVTEIYPLIKKNLPDTTFTIVGRNPGREILGLKKTDQSIEVTGTVPDVRPYIERAKLFVVPLRIGGGSRLKILEAFSMGKPVLSTTIGAEGLTVRNGEEIVIADDSEAFAKSAIRLMEEPDECRRICDNARSLVETHYSWDIIYTKQLKFWSELCSGIR